MQFKPKDLRATALGANQTVIHHNGVKTFISYGSVIAIVDNGKVSLGEDWCYSRTTSKYRSQFLGENTKETRAKLITGIYTMIKDNNE